MKKTRFFLLPGGWRELWAALRTLTALPLPKPPPTANSAGPSEAMGAYPLAGIVIGLLPAGLDWLLGHAALPLGVRDAVLVAALALVTGGMPLAGLMATCDRLLSGRAIAAPPPRMREPRVGPYGVLCGAGVLLLKVALLGALPIPGRVPALIAAPMLGRWSLVLAAWLFPAPGVDARGDAAGTGVTSRALSRAASTCVLVTAAMGSAAVTALLLCCLATWALGRALPRRSPSLTTDSAGAICELNELLALLVLAFAI